MRPTRLRTLVALAVLAGGAAYLLLRLFYGDVPPLPAAAPASLGLLAGAELVTAVSLRARMRGRPGTRPVDPLVVARYTALAKASSVTGALAAGGYGAVLAYTLPMADKVTPRGDAVVAGVGIATALALVVAALVLEQVGRLPDPPPGPGGPDGG